MIFQFCPRKYFVLDIFLEHFLGFLMLLMDYLEEKVAQNTPTKYYVFSTSISKSKLV
jgi:hypothetical protein